MFQDLRSYLPQFLEKHGLTEQAYLMDVIQWFNSFLDTLDNTEIKKYVRGLYVKDSCFYIGVTANAAAQELQMAKSSLITYINSNLKDNKISDIRCKVVSDKG